MNFEIHKTSMVVATGGMFMVPRGELLRTFVTIKVIESSVHFREFLHDREYL